MKIITFYSDSHKSLYDIFVKSFNDNLSSSGEYNSIDNIDVNDSSPMVTDAILLSLTDFKLLTKSNVSIFSNICNLKQDTFTYMDKFINYI